MHLQIPGSEGQNWKGWHRANYQYRSHTKITVLDSLPDELPLRHLALTGISANSSILDHIATS
jgi:hypothetical protein